MHSKQRYEPDQVAPRQQKRYRPCPTKDESKKIISTRQLEYHQHAVFEGVSSIFNDGDHVGA